MSSTPNPGGPTLADFPNLHQHLCMACGQWSNQHGVPDRFNSLIVYTAFGQWGHVIMGHRFGLTDKAYRRLIADYERTSPVPLERAGSEVRELALRDPDEVEP